MARPGVTYNEVAEAVQRIRGQGKNPTIEQIRLILGTGSSTTIANHLREWKQTQEDTSLIAGKENIPQELVSMLKGVWERINHTAAEKIKNAEIAATKIQADLQQELNKYKNNNQRWQTLFNQWSKEKTELLHSIRELEQVIVASEKALTSLQTKQDVSVEQLNEKQNRITELHNLHRLAQNNLEHYRESSREQRLIEQQQFDQQKQELQWELKTTGEQFILLRNQHNELQNQSLILQNEHNIIKENFSSLSLEAEKDKIKATNLQKELDLLVQEKQFLNSQLKIAQNASEKNTQQIIELNAEKKFLEQKFLEASESLKEAKEQNKLLSHDRWILTKEKAQLEGQLHQLDRIKGKVQN